MIIEPIYDRADFVGRTLTTVLTNLVEGALVVTVVLALLLGTIRGALVVVLGIPASMSIALFGMHLFGVTGDLMSLGAIDFGFLVDGPIVILEAVMAATAGRELVTKARASTPTPRSRRRSRARSRSRSRSSCSSTSRCSRSRASRARCSAPWR